VSPQPEEVRRRANGATHIPSETRVVVGRPRSERRARSLNFGAPLSKLAGDATTRRDRLAAM